MKESSFQIHNNKNIDIGRYVWYTLIWFKGINNIHILCNNRPKEVIIFCGNPIIFNYCLRLLSISGLLFMFITYLIYFYILHISFLLFITFLNYASMIEIFSIIKHNFDLKIFGQIAAMCQHIFNTYLGPSDLFVCLKTLWVMNIYFVKRGMGSEQGNQ